MGRNHSGRRNAPPRNQAGSQAQVTRAPPRDSGGSDGWIWGTHAVLAALANPRRRPVLLLATENAVARIGPQVLSPTVVAARDIDQRLPPGAVHQGIALKVPPLAAVSVADLLDHGATRVAVLDQVSDPHNLGAIFRSAAAFGFAGLVLQTRNAPDITGVVAKSAAGAIETVSEVRAVNIARTLEELGEAGFHTVGLAGDSPRLLDAAVRGAAKIAVVLGAEGDGLRPAVAKACAELARIPIASEMESLNVSNAAAIAFYEVARNDFPVR